MIMARWSAAFFEAERRDEGTDLLADAIWIVGTVDLVEETLLAVVIDQRGGLLVVLLEAVTDDLGLVVVADEEFGTVDVADAFLRRRVEFDVVDVALLVADPSAGQPVDDRLVVDVDQDHGGQLAT